MRTAIYRIGKSKYFRLLSAVLCFIFSFKFITKPVAVRKKICYNILYYAPFCLRLG